MKLTIAIANFNRAWYLDRSIPLLAAQTFPNLDFEVIVVDDGSSDNSETIMRYHRAHARMNLHFLKRKVPREKYGNCAIARNIGAKIGSGACILFSDPEVMPLPDWAQKHYLANCAIVEPGKAGSLCLLEPTNHVPGSDEIATDRYVLGRAMVLRNVHVLCGQLLKPWKEPLVFADWRHIKEAEARCLDKINSIRGEGWASEKQVTDEFFLYQFSQGGVSISRSLFERIGGFEEDYCRTDLGLDKWAGEDSWFMHCANKHSRGMVREPTARAIHLPHPVDHSGCAAPGYTAEKIHANPDLCVSNPGREWGSIKENGFELVF